MTTPAAIGRARDDMQSPAELLAAAPQELRASGMSTRKGATLRALAERFVDGRLSDKALARNELVQLAERWRPYRSLAASYLFASEFEKGT